MNGYTDEELGDTPVGRDQQAREHAQKNEDDIRRMKFEYIQIFGIFASIITLVGAGYNQNISWGKLIIFGMFLIIFDFLLFWIPKLKFKTLSFDILINKLFKKLSIFCKKIYLKRILSIISILLLTPFLDLGLCKYWPTNNFSVLDYSFCGDGSLHNKTELSNHEKVTLKLLERSFRSD